MDETVLCLHVPEWASVWGMEGRGMREEPWIISRFLDWPVVWKMMPFSQMSK